MASVGFLILISLVGLAIVLVALAARWGMDAAFVRLCWVPLAALTLALVQKDRLGLEILLVLAMIVFVTVGLVGLGVTLAVGAARRGSASASPLMWGTLAAATPLLLLVALWVIQALRAH